MVLKISCTDPNVNVSALDFGEIFKGPVEGRPLRGETLVALDRTRYLIQDIVVSNVPDVSLTWQKVQYEYVLKKLNATEDTTWNDNESVETTTIDEEPKKNTKFFLTFPGVGARTYYEQHPDNTRIIILSQDRIETVKKCYGHYDYIFVYFEEVPKFKKLDPDDMSSLMTVEDVSTLSAIKSDKFFDDKDVFVIYPDKSLKLDYIDRYRDRGDNQTFVTAIGFHWDEWINDIEKSYGEDVILYKLKKNEMLTDAIEMIEKWEKTKPKS